MIASTTAAKLLAAGLAGAAFLCLCDQGRGVANTQVLLPASQVADTSSVRLHISGMTCGSCPITARVALQRLTGVYHATVTLPDSTGVVTYDPQRVTPSQIVAQLTHLTGYTATIVRDMTATSRHPAGS